PLLSLSHLTQTNIYFYAAAILLSTKLSAYKGSVAKNILLDIIKINHFDLPSNIERNPADYAKLVAVIQDTLTQLRSKIKNAVRKPAASARKHQNIFDSPLISSKAPKRQVYIEDSGLKFWDSLDADLCKIRNRAGGNVRKLNKCVSNYIPTRSLLT
ncbi:hypothetical protein B0H10DRAFT_1772517, partial [Mycena sp. CBHHK59/15]